MLLEKPSKVLVDLYLEKWEELEDYTAHEIALKKLFIDDYNTNTNLSEIMVKCSVLNDLYSTQIRKIYTVAKHILNCNIDDRIRKN